MKKLSIIVAISLAGCGTPKQPGIEIRTVETVVTRVEKCIDPTDVPKKPAALPRRPSSDARVLADLLLSKVRQWENYGDKADPVLKGCAG